MVNTLLFSLCLVVPILIWTKNPLIFRQRPFFLVFAYFWTENPLILLRRPFFFGLHLFLVRKRVPPRNPAPGATIFSNASAQLCYLTLINNPQLLQQQKNNFLFVQKIKFLSVCPPPLNFSKIPPKRKKCCCSSNF